ncbi:metallophosphatase family protein [Halobacillus litoralis]|uniref:metallophosphoesterase family protein n=1 Tax=Halobacillus litoralis TaxID=45668 RepID=UPI001CD6F807|nr:metallophosphoesterase family protein [Halobacillus litoralis]MCA0969647.1 metallophosphatase family protein [Halobacillus litoralis]
MSIALLTDVHGNAPALRAVLDDLDQQESVERIIVLGDMLAIGPDSNDVLSMLFSRSDVSMITGNHDECVLALLRDESHPKSHAHVKTHHQWIADHLEARFIPKLESLTRTLQVEWNGWLLHFSHYGLGKPLEHISEDPFKRIVEPSFDNVARLFHDIQADLIGFGHHHPEHFYRGNDTIYINPGALGCSHTAHAPYAIVDKKNGSLDVKVKKVPYDNVEFLKSYEELQVPARKTILEIFHGNQHQE